MILSTDSIEKLCKGKHPLIKPYNLEENRKNPAKTELHLGAHCYCSGSPDADIIELEKDGDSVILKPNTIFLFETKEVLNFPNNLSGHMSLKMGLVSQGLLMPSQTQVDPGYNNVLFGMIYNLSSRDVELKRGQAITTLEVFETEISKHQYSGRMQSISFEQFVKIRINSSLGTLEEDIRKSKEKLDDSIKYWDKFSAFITIVITVFSLVIGMTSVGTVFKDDAEISKLEYQVEMLTKEVEEYKSIIKQKSLISDENERISDTAEETPEFETNIETEETPKSGDNVEEENK